MAAFLMKMTGASGRFSSRSAETVPEEIVPLFPPPQSVIRMYVSQSLPAKGGLKERHIFARLDFRAGGVVDVAFTGGGVQFCDRPGTFSVRHGAAFSRSQVGKVTSGDPNGTQQQEMEQLAAGLHQSLSAVLGYDDKQFATAEEVLLHRTARYREQVTIADRVLRDIFSRQADRDGANALAKQLREWARDETAIRAAIEISSANEHPFAALLRGAPVESGAPVNSDDIREVGDALRDMAERLEGESGGTTLAELKLQFGASALPEIQRVGQEAASEFASLLDEPVRAHPGLVPT